MRYLPTDNQENNKFLKITYKEDEYFIDKELISKVGKIRYNGKKTKENEND